MGTSSLACAILRDDGMQHAVIVSTPYYVQIQTQEKLISSQGNYYSTTVHCPLEGRHKLTCSDCMQTREIKNHASDNQMAKS